MFLQQKNDVGKPRFHKPNILRRKIKTPISNEPQGINLVTPTASSKNSPSKDSRTCKPHEAEPTEQKLSHNFTNNAEEDINRNVDICLNRTLFDPELCQQKAFGTSLFDNHGTEPECLEDDIIQYVLGPIELFETSTCLDVMPIESSLSSDMKEAPAIDSPNNSTMFECHYEGCIKSFPTKQKLNKHITRHKKAKPQKDAQQLLKCPAFKPKTSEQDDTHIVCDRVFEVRKDLVKHLTNDHSAEDGIHSCEKCGRRFFTVAGFRVHRRSCGAAAARRVLACPWEGCARTFLQPCRLREHSRAHTGDRPYPCKHPGCSWSFRTASKLVRHARRHTGERRHACGTCGVSFRRREHLRDHQRRHANAPKRPKCTQHHTPCSYEECDQLFKDTKSLNAHIRAVHEKKSLRKQQQASTEPMWTSGNHSLMDEHDILNREEYLEGPIRREESELRCARTHCTWPLIAVTPLPVAANQDTQVELSEGSESNASTIRSDLFLHGNVLPIEDNDSCSVREVSLSRSCEEAPEPYSGHVALLHAGYDHLTLPPIDLLQEELLYTDAAVDESSFQILLLSDPDLN